MRRHRGRLRAAHGLPVRPLMRPPRAAASVAAACLTASLDLPLLAKGKVREIYDLGDDLLMVASDRISTYDVIHPTPIPDKGRVLTGLSVLWFGLTGDIVPNHFVSATDGVPDEVRGRGAARAAAGDAAGRVRRARLHHRLGLEGLPARRARLGHRAAGRACRSPSGSPSRSSRPPRRPRRATTRRSTSSSAAELVGSRELAERAARRLDRRLRARRRARARARRDPRRHEVRVRARRATASCALGDEVCTPDSSRFWPADEYEPGRGQPSFDKQYVRDWASGTGWDKTPPAPAIPDDVVAAARASAT